MRFATTLPVVVLYLASPGHAGEIRPCVDTMPDTWVATDELGRVLPGFKECGRPRPDRTVGIFYFLWLGAHDITKILAKDPAAMTNQNSPPWGPMHAAHHWGESVFGYYNTNDPYVLGKHAQMLSDAGVDVVIFDVTNQITYRKNYMALLRASADVRAKGGKTPQSVIGRATTTTRDTRTRPAATTSSSLRSRGTKVVSFSTCKPESRSPRRSERTGWCCSSIRATTIEPAGKAMTSS
jgi:hypothetical protein